MKTSEVPMAACQEAIPEIDRSIVVILRSSPNLSLVDPMTATAQ